MAQRLITPSSHLACSVSRLCCVRQSFPWTRATRSQQACARCGRRDAVKTSVVYVGDARPAALLIDFKLLQAAPAVLNRSGVGDLLSCYTALWDWNEAHVRLGEPIDSAIVRRTRELLERLLSLGSAKAVNAVTEDGLRLLSELYVLEVTLCELWGNARPELKTVTRQRF